MEELNEQMDAETGAAPEEGAGTDQAASGEATTEATPQDIQSQIDAAVQEAIKQYEGKDGHLAKLKSSKDKQIAKLKSQLTAQQKSKVEEAKALVEKDPDQAAQILLNLAEEQGRQVEQDQKYEALTDWQHRILTDLGMDPKEDEEVAELAAEYAGKIIENPGYSHDFQQAAAALKIERERAESKQAQKELKELKESLPDTVNAAVTRALVAAGIVPEPTDEGGAPPEKEDWRKSPSVARGLEARKKQPIKRT